MWAYQMKELETGDQPPDVEVESGEINVLVVDDCEDILAAFQGYFELRGVNVWLASSAEQAWSMFNGLAKNVSVVLSDIQMPGENGIWLLEQLKKSREELPVFLMSGDYEAYHGEAQSKGAVELFPKSSNFDEICHQVVSVVIKQEDEE